MRQANQQHGSEPALSLRPWQRGGCGGWAHLQAPGPESDDIYGKVVRADGERGERLARIHMTSTSDADAERLEALLR